MREFEIKFIFWYKPRSAVHKNKLFGVLLKIAILGGGSCFALSLARVANAAGHEVIGIGRAPMKPTCFSLEFSYVRRDYRYFQAHIVDDLDNALLFLDLFEPDVIVNFAAQGEGAVSHIADNWAYFYRTNVYGLVELVRALARRKWLKRFIHIGTSELYGSVTAPASETAPVWPSSIYAHSKATFDRTLEFVRDLAGFPMNIIRPSNCYVKGQQLHRVIPRALLSAMTGRTMQLHGGGTARKSYLHADDLAKAILLVAEKAPLGEIYNCGPDNPTSIREVVDRCAKHAQRPFASFVEQADERMGQDSCYWLDSRKIQALGWKQEIDWDRGLADTAAWVSAYKDDLLRLDTGFQIKA